MDLYCPKCGEPCENDYFHDVAESTGQTYSEVAAKFRVVGCEALGPNEKHSEPSKQTDKGFGLTRQEAAGALYDLLGDDMDGAASMLDDMGF